MKKVFILAKSGDQVEAAIKYLESVGCTGGWYDRDSVPAVSEAIVSDWKGGISWAADIDYLLCGGFKEVFLPTTKQAHEHPHQESLTKWLTDVSQKIWAGYEGGSWSDISPQHLIGSGACGLKVHVGHQPPKRKIMIGSVEIDAPEREPLQEGQEYYTTIVTYDSLFIKSHWDGRGVDTTRLKRGLIHLTKEAAIAHAKALIALTGECE